MMLYASRTGTVDNIALMSEFGWRVLVSAAGEWRSEGLPYALDNGAWTYAQRGEAFDEGRFSGLVELLGDDADWIVLPDVVCDAPATARLTDAWVGRLEGRRLLAVIQNGATEQHLDRLLGHVHGFFLGGDDDFKLSTMRRWGKYCAERKLHYHVGRVNSERRIRWCVNAGAHSCDGTSVTKYAKMNIARLTRARDRAVQEREQRRQTGLFEDDWV